MGIVWLARPSLPFPTCGRLGNIQSRGATILSIAQECNASKVKREGFTTTSQHPFRGISYTQALWTLMFGSLLCAVERLTL